MVVAGRYALRGNHWVRGRPMTSPHRAVNPEGLPRASGFSHALVAAPGRAIYLGGQAGLGPDGTVVPGGLLAQFDKACTNVVVALEGTGARPEHLVAMQIYVTDAGAYRSRLRELGNVYRRHFGAHYPAIALLEVTSLFEPDALVELVCTAVVPEE